MVLINALGQGLAYWSRLFDALSLHRRVIVWGATASRRPSDLTLADQVTDLERILDCEGVARCLAVAWCTGPKVALELCRRRPAAGRGDGVSQSVVQGAGRSPASFDKRLRAHAPATVRAGGPPSRHGAHGSQRVCATASRRGSRPTSPAWAAAAPAAMNADLREHVLDPFRTDSITVAYCRQLLDFWSHDPTRPRRRSAAGDRRRIRPGRIAFHGQGRVRSFRRRAICRDTRRYPLLSL